MSKREAVHSVLNSDEVDEVLRGSFYGAAPVATTSERSKTKPPKPDHYEIICISMYKDDLARLDRKVAELKAAGHRKMNRSALIRFALDTVDPSRLPRSY